MNKILIYLLIATAPAAAQWRHFGQDSARLTGFFGVGPSEPINPIARSLNTGWNFTGGIGVTSKYVGVTLDGMYNDFRYNRRTQVDFGVPRGHDRFWAVTVDPVVHVNEHGPVDFYITGGGGLYSEVADFPQSFGRGVFIDSFSIYKAGVNGGAGFAFGLGGHHNRFKLFAEAKFHHMFTRGPGSSFVPVTLGVRF